MGGGGGTDIQSALLEALLVAQNAQIQENIDPSHTQQMIIFLTDGQASVDLDKIKKFNQDLQIPIYSLALGDDADFNLLQEISNDNHGFAQMIYESGNSFEQIEVLFNGICDPKLKNVNFEYLFNGHKVPAAKLTTTKFDQVSGNNDIWIVGKIDDTVREDIAISYYHPEDYGHKQDLSFQVVQYTNGARENFLSR